MFGLRTLFQKHRRENALAEVPEKHSDPLSGTATQDLLLSEASAYLHLFHQECGFFAETPERLAEIQTEIKNTGFYTQTSAELTYGARVAWRNNTRCIGRLHWQTLSVRDMRHLSSAEEIFEALLEHLRFATNGGKIRSTMTVFPPALPDQEGIRIWNAQLIRYAGYRQPDGSIIGDPLQADLTDLLLKMGWPGGERTPFDIIPIVIKMPGQKPQMFEVPPELVLEVPLSHPDYAWFTELGLKWHALPVISNMRMEIGGISYTAAPFNGWYMGTEIGARNLGDSKRYNLLPVIAERLGLDTRSDRSLWRDRALVELNVAVLSSFTERGIAIVDHHTASRQFLLHDAREKRHGRDVPAHWVWLVPPISGSASPLFHITTYKNIRQKPNFFYQPEPGQQIHEGCPLESHTKNAEQAELVCPYPK